MLSFSCQKSIYFFICGQIFSHFSVDILSF
nr:MAG TPA: hypothetical protein [Caudoviricetes sp.]